MILQKLMSPRVFDEADEEIYFPYEIEKKKMQEETSRIENDPADTGITVWVCCPFFPTCLLKLFRQQDGTMALARIFCSNPSIVQGKKILELGSGTGLLGCICSRFLLREAFRRLAECHAL